MYKWKISFLTITAVLGLLCSFPAFAQENDNSFVNAGPGVQAVQEPVESEPPAEPVPAEVSLGTFKITGYCGCERCSGEHKLTYSGTVPKAHHTISPAFQSGLSCVSAILSIRLKIRGHP